VRVGQDQDPNVVNVGDVKTTEIVNQLNDFPPTAEVLQLDKQVVPDSMHVYYESWEATDPQTGKTERSDKATYWRYATLQDIANFDLNVRMLNDAAKKNPDLKNFGESFSWIKHGVGDNYRYKKYLEYLKYIAGGNDLPKEFLLLSGQFTAGCGDTNWDFSIDTPLIELDAALIRNTSSEAILIQALKVRASESTHLRRVADSAPSVARELSVAVTLLPGQTLVVPTAIRMRSDYGKFTTESNIKGKEVHDRLVSKGIQASPDVYGVPKRPVFVFGPQIEIDDLVISGSQVGFTSKQKDFVDISFSGGLGSCPYLLSWSEEENDWVERGKVLDKAHGPELKQSQAISMSGLRTRFRLEEREAEAATLDRAELVLTLKDGTEVAAALVVHWGTPPPFRIFWGEGLEFTFSMPPGVAANDVTRSRLVLTGYYQRYSSLPGLLQSVRAMGD
jgi:hypothetical protein